MPTPAYDDLEEDDYDELDPPHYDTLEATPPPAGHIVVRAVVYSPGMVRAAVGS